jgi:hypothetical protein
LHRNEKLLLAGTAPAALLVIVKVIMVLILSFRKRSLKGKTLQLRVGLHERTIIPWKLGWVFRHQPRRNRGRSRKEVVVVEDSVVVFAAPWPYTEKWGFEKALILKRDVAVCNCKFLSVLPHRILCGLDCEGDPGRGSLKLEVDVEELGASVHGNKLEAHGCILLMLEVRASE